MDYCLFPPVEGQSLRLRGGILLCIHSTWHETYLNKFIE